MVVYATLYLDKDNRIITPVACVTVSRRVGPVKGCDMLIQGGRVVHEFIAMTYHT